MSINAQSDHKPKKKRGKSLPSAFLLLFVNLHLPHSRIYVLKYEERNIKNLVSTVQPGSVLRQREVYQLQSPMEYFRISNFPILLPSPLFCPESLN